MNCRAAADRECLDSGHPVTGVAIASGIDNSAISADDFPFAGLGVLDAALIVLINAEGVADPADLIAAILLPLPPGLAALTAWRRPSPGAENEQSKATRDQFPR